MTPEMEHALAQMELLENCGAYIPPKSRNAIIEAILAGCYNGYSPDGITIEIAEAWGVEVEHTIIAEEEKPDRPFFGL